MSDQDTFETPGQLATYFVELKCQYLTNDLATIVGEARRVTQDFEASLLGQLGRAGKADSLFHIEKMNNLPHVLVSTTADVADMIAKMPEVEEIFLDKDNIELAQS